MKVHLCCRNKTCHNFWLSWAQVQILNCLKPVQLLPSLLQCHDNNLYKSETNCCHHHFIYLFIQLINIYIIYLFAEQQNKCDKITSIICWWLDKRWLNLDSSKSYFFLCIVRSSCACLQSATNVALCFSDQSTVCDASSTRCFNIIINCDCSSIRDWSIAFSERSISDNPLWFKTDPVLVESSSKMSYKWLRCTQ